MHENIYRGLLAAVLMALLCGCGGDDENKSAGPSSPSGNAPPPAPPPSSQPGAATLEWTVPTIGTDGIALADLAGYRIHYGKSVGALNTTIEIRNPSVSSYVIEGLAPGTYYFAVTAFNARNHESERSNAGKKDIS